MAKKKLLPKNFGELIEAGDLQALIAVFDTCALDARNGRGGQTAIGVYGCPEALIRWLVAQGAAIDVADQYGRTPLHQHISVGNSAIVAVLLELGADIDGPDRSSDPHTPLQGAAFFHKAATLRLLLDRGAHALAVTQRGATALELGLNTCRNADIAAMADIAEALLAAGTPINEKMRCAVERIGKDFEFTRPAFNPDYLEETDAGLARLYSLFSVAPVEVRRMHDGVSPIVVKATHWRQQHQELWDLLVPPKAAAQTVQGEVIRITGRIAHEQLDNGGGNWDRDYRMMLDALLRHLSSGASLSEPDMQEARRCAADVHGDGAALHRLSELAVRWVLSNPEPARLGKPAYRR